LTQRKICVEGHLHVRRSWGYSVGGEEKVVANEQGKRTEKGVILFLKERGGVTWGNSKTEGAKKVITSPGAMAIHDVQSNWGERCDSNGEGKVLHLTTSLVNMSILGRKEGGGTDQEEFLVKEVLEVGKAKGCAGT